MRHDDPAGAHRGLAMFPDLTGQILIAHCLRLGEHSYAQLCIAVRKKRLFSTKLKRSQLCKFLELDKIFGI